RIDATNKWRNTSRVNHVDNDSGPISEIDQRGWRAECFRKQHHRLAPRHILKTLDSPHQMSHRIGSVTVAPVSLGRLARYRSGRLKRNLFALPVGMGRWFKVPQTVSWAPRDMVNGGMHLPLVIREAFKKPMPPRLAVTAISSPG